jgi:Polyketide cyclase / dehydrase and lipid transport
MKDDLAHRSPDIHWPAGFAPAKADLFAHNELIISASCARVWSHLIDAGRWPSWYPNSKDVQIQGAEQQLSSGTVFRWTTFGLSIESKVQEYVPNQRLGWFGYAGLRQSDETLMHRGHDLWLATLKWVAEGK